MDLFSDPDVVRYAGDGEALSAETLGAQFTRIFSLYDSDPDRFIAAVDEDGEFAGHAEIVRRSGRPEFELVYFLQRARWGRSQTAPSFFCDSDRTPEQQSVALDS